MAANNVSIRVPPEVLKQIFSYLAGQDVLNVSLVSRPWHVWSQEHLYREPSLMVAPSKVGLFLRTLLSPGLGYLATYVRVLRARVLPCGLGPNDQHILPALTAAVAQLRLPYHTFTGGEQVMLLLHLLPRLESLFLRSVSDITIVYTLLSTANGTQALPLGLQSIRHISCTWGHRSYGLLPDNVMDLALLPHIRSIHTQMHAMLPIEFPAIHHGTSNVTSINLTCWNFKIETLGYILCLPRALTSLSLSADINWNATETGALQLALEPVRMTLQKLVLDFRYPWDEMGVVPQSVCLSLQRWPMLRSLSCAARVLLGDKHSMPTRHLDGLLPPSLLELRFDPETWTWGNDPMPRELVRLMEQKANLVPLLQTVSWRMGSLNNPVVKQLITICENAGVTLEM